MTDDVIKTNQEFYVAFANGDFKTLKSLWATAHELSVIHPGWACLHGREAVMESWQSILQDGQKSDIKCRDATVYYPDNYSAYVICHEVFPQGELIATNIFVKEKASWRMIHHQAGPVNQPGRHSKQSLH